MDRPALKRLLDDVRAHRANAKGIKRQTIANRRLQHQLQAA
jgi:hypothetical protein